MLQGVIEEYRKMYDTLLLRASSRTSVSMVSRTEMVGGPVMLPVEGERDRERDLVSSAISISLYGVSP
jgi:hypothetical protein